MVVPIIPVEAYGFCAVWYANQALTSLPVVEFALVQLSFVTTNGTQ